MATVATGAQDSPFVGRTAELAELTGRRARARAGSGGLVLLSGPAGIGKTRTVEEAIGTGPGVVWGRCVDDPGAPPLWAWRRVLAARPDLGAAVADTLAELDLARDRSADPVTARFRFVSAAAEALLAAAEKGELLVVLEDLHWADEASLRLLRHLAAELHRSRLLVVGTYREPGGHAGDAPLDHALPDLLRWPGTHPLALPTLTEDDVRSYLTAGGARDADEVHRLHRRCGGNPLYLRAVARLPVGHAAGASVGAEIRHLVRTALATLDRPTQDLLATAAVLGEEIDPGLLAVVAERPLEQVHAQMDTAVLAGVLAAVPDAPGRRRFVHAVVRDGIYADLPPSTREQLHRRAAEAWENSVGVDELSAGVVAGHWLRAAAGPAALQRAAAWARRAAEAATRSLAFDEAARFLAMALEATGRAGGTDDEARADLLVDLAVAEFRAGRSAAALEHAVTASDLAATQGRADLLVAAALAVHDVSGHWFPAQQVRLCERALASSEATRSSVVRARLLSQLASALIDAGRITAADAPSAEALALAEASGEPEALIDAVRARMKAAPDALDRAERLRLGRLAVEHAAATGQPLAALWGHKWRIDAQFETGDLVAAAEEMAHVTALAHSTRLPLIRWHDLRLRASLASLVGRFRDAVDLNEQARGLAETALAEDLSAAGLSIAFLSQHHLVTGGSAEWAAAGLAVLKDANDVPVVLVSRALLALLAGREEEAAARYEELRPRLAEPDFAASAGVSVNVLPLVEHFADAESARLLAARLARRPVAAFGAGIYASGSTSSLLGRLAAVRGDWDEAVTRFEEALAVDARTGARPAVVLGRTGLAAALMARGNAGDLVRARTLAEQALAEARRLDMPGPASRASALLTRARAASRAADPLSGREREIASLVAQALTNRQIAERLFLSERTVESHVRNILAKLGLANRTEIAMSAVGARRG